AEPSVDICVVNWVEFSDLVRVAVLHADAIEQPSRQSIGYLSIRVRVGATVHESQHVSFRRWRELLIVGNVGSRYGGLLPGQISNDLVFGLIGDALDILLLA